MYIVPSKFEDESDCKQTLTMCKCMRQLYLYLSVYLSEHADFIV